MRCVPHRPSCAEEALTPFDDEMFSKSTATVRPGTATVRGQLSPDLVQRTVRQRLEPLKRCYEDALLVGQVVVVFTIDSHGNVSNAERATGTTLTDKWAVDCIVRSFITVAFPAPTADVTVVYPFSFSR